ncbi:hypothetical protein DGG96_10370 [Legionella qingyii]|uniref:Glycosyltransferase RgtA/B/C/D-like domain-containing protein n=1 Tax=Legionella qingyii TaxID=2184757 RepID=A0A317U2X4_9GAMM|nr:hypothetical protein [Legionella qingyii]PWY55689.1 hypothetical protein DGG96_10370 [Legionella qingyii]RUR21643.1 hypothetical protein ELY20_11845 [Legionella qingyii]RUR25089.1 hypothetical protein ELY16_10525 [Legionella qingyii]
MNKQSENIKISSIANLLFLFLLAIIFYLTYKYMVPAEDAIILYDYAKNLSMRGIITYSNSSYPIEGATDFLWMVILAVLKKVHIDEFESALILNYLGVCLIFYCMKKRDFPLILIIMGILGTPYLYSALIGFSTLFYSAIYVCALYFVLLRKSECYFFIFILCLIRPDGVIWGIGLIFLHIYLAESNFKLKDDLFKFLIYLIIPGLFYFGWRVWYFAEWLPLPFLVKSSSQRDYGIFFLDSLKMIQYPLIPMLITVFFLKSKNQYIKRIFLLFFIPIIFFSCMHLEQNNGNRFLAPMFFGSLMLIAEKKEAMASWAFIVTSLLYGIKLTFWTFLSFIDVNDYNENIINLSKSLSKFHGRMLTTEAGRLSYYSNWDTEDSWGLNTPRYAHRLINTLDLYNGHYNLIVAHCPISMLDSGIIKTYFIEERAWENQCRVLTSYILSERYDIYLVPFIHGQLLSNQLLQLLNLNHHKEKCRRYDIYAIAKDFKYNADVKKIIINFEGIPYSSNRSSDLCNF